MANRDLYEILGVARDAAPEAIKKAYRTLVRKFHPDVNPGDKTAEARFKEVQEAYDILSDKEKRALYDRHGHAAFDGVTEGGPRVHVGEWTSRFGDQGFEAIDLSDLLRSFGAEPQVGPEPFDDIIRRARSGRPSRPRTGRAVEADLTIPFLTAVRGGESTIQIQRSGGKSESLVVKIPPGVDNGAKLRLKGQGEQGQKGCRAGTSPLTCTSSPIPTSSTTARPSSRGARHRWRGHSRRQDRRAHARRHEIGDDSGRELRRAQVADQRARRRRFWRQSPR